MRRGRERRVVQTEIGWRIHVMLNESIGRSTSDGRGDELLCF